MQAKMKPDNDKKESDLSKERAKEIFLFMQKEAAKMARGAA